MVERETEHDVPKVTGVPAVPSHPSAGAGRRRRARPGILRTETVMGAAGIVAVGFIGSRILGLVRSVAIAEAFGTAPELDAYWVAFRLPDLVFQLLAGGTVSAAFIPVFSRVLLDQGQAGGWRLASSVLNLLAIATAVLAGLAFLLAPVLVPVIAPGLGADTPREAELNALAVDLTRLMLISPLFFGISGMLTGILNGRQHFIAPALAPMIYNAGIIFGAVVLSRPFGIHGLAWGVVVGAFGHLLVQAPVLALLGMRWSPALDLASHSVREVMRLMVPRVVGLAATQVNFLVVVFFASFLENGAISALTFAFLVMMMPVGVVGMAISTAAFPTLAQQAAAGRRDRLSESLTRALRAILFLALPASVGLMLLAEPVVRLLFQYGAFDARSTQLVAGALVLYAAGIGAHSSVEILSRGFYALANTKTPVQVAVIGMLVNLGLSAVLVWRFEIQGLAAAATIAAAAEFALLAMLLAGALRGFSGYGLRRSVVRTMLSTALMAEVVLLARLLLERAGADVGTWLGALVVVVVAGTAGLLAYLAASVAVNREEYDVTFGRLLR